MKKRSTRDSLSLHLMLLPGVILTLIYSYVPMAGLAIAFQDFNPAKGLFGLDYVGWANFQFLFDMPDTFQVIGNTFYIAFWEILGLVVVPVFFSLLLNEVRSKVYKRYVQSVIYLPNFLSWIILSAIFIDVLSPSSGIVNAVLRAVGLPEIFFLGDADVFPYTMIVTSIWQGFGFGTVVYLAAITAIDPTLYEAASIDGASKMTQVWEITVRGIVPMIILMTVLSLGNILNMGFEQIFNLYNPAVYRTGDIVDTMVYRVAMQQGLFAPAAAMGLFKSLVSLVLVSTSYFVAYKFANYRIF